MKIFRRYALWFLVVLFLFSACQAKQPALKHKLRVGFDVDDTLLFSTPAFQKGFESGVKPFSREFWEIVNASDSAVSKIKQTTYALVQKYKKQGAEIFVITARQPYNGIHLKRFIHEKFGIPLDHIYFAPEGKTELMKKLKLDIFYGDSDSDITDALAAGVKPVRVQRSPKSSYKKKYHPGQYGEEILPDSEN